MAASACPTPLQISNFTFVHHPTNLSIKSFVQFHSPQFKISCYAESPSSTGANVPIGSGTWTSIPCKGSQNGYFQVAKDGVNASVEFSTWQQCAASQFHFHYKANVTLECSEDEAGVQTCGDGNAKGGNSTAGIDSLEWLQPVRPPPPPPYVYVPPASTPSSTAV